MKGDLLGSWLLATAMMGFGCAATDQKEAAQDETHALAQSQSTVPTGTIMELVLDDELSLAASKPGDSFMARVKSPVVGEGKTLIPSEARVRGSVTAIEELPDSEGKRILAVDFREIEVNGHIHPLHASMIEAQPEIQPRAGKEAALGKSTAKTREDTAPETQEANAAGTDAAAAEGAPSKPAAPEGTPEVSADSWHHAAGTTVAALGSIVSISEGHDQGDASGAEVKKAIVLETKDGSATLPAGSAVRVRLERSLELVPVGAH